MTDSQRVCELVGFEVGKDPYVGDRPALYDPSGEILGGVCNTEEICWEYAPDLTKNIQAWFDWVWPWVYEEGLWGEFETQWEFDNGLVEYLKLINGRYAFLMDLPGQIQAFLKVVDDEKPDLPYDHRGWGPK